MLSQTFGMNLDAMDIIKAKNPEEIIINDVGKDLAIIRREQGFPLTIDERVVQLFSELLQALFDSLLADMAVWLLSTSL